MNQQPEHPHARQDAATASARQRLARTGRLARYQADTLKLVAQATLPRHTAGERLDDHGLAQLVGAVEVLAQAGHTAERLPALIADYKQRHRERWREAFWARTLRIAAIRYRHPERYGRSPCEPVTVAPAAPAEHPAG